MEIKTTWPKGAEKSLAPTKSTTRAEHLFVLCNMLFYIAILLFNRFVVVDEVTAAGAAVKKTDKFEVRAFACPQHQNRSWHGNPFKPPAQPFPYSHSPAG